MKQPIQFFFFLSILSALWITALAQNSRSISGRVQGYVWNRIGDYDGFRLQAASGEFVIYFPPHTAAIVRRVASVGKVVVVDVEPGPVRPGPAGLGPARPALAGPGQEASSPTDGTFRLIRVRNRSTGTALQIAAVPPPPPQSGKLVQAEGPLVERILDEAGQLAGLLTDKYVIDLKPHQREQIGSLLAGVTRLGVVGYERSADGFVNRSGHPLLHPTSLTIRGQTFAL